MSANLKLPSEALNVRFELPQESTQAVAASARQTAERSDFRGHGFIAGDIGLLLPPAMISEVSDPVPICRLPNTPHWLLGVVNLRGNMVPVFDISRVLGFDQEAPSQRYKLLFVHIRDEWVGMKCKDLPVKLHLKAQRRLVKAPALPKVLLPHVRDCYHERSVWVEWDIDKFFLGLMANNY